MKLPSVLAAACFERLGKGAADGARRNSYRHLRRTGGARRGDRSCCRGTGLFETRLCLEELPPLIHGRLPPQGRRTPPHAVPKTEVTLCNAIRRKKSLRNSVFC